MNVGAETASRARDPPFLAGGGEAGALLRARDWSGSPLGPPERWPAALKAATAMCLASPAPLMVWAGTRIDDLVQIYNDAARPMLGSRHPAALGSLARDTWATRWEDVAAALGPVLLGESLLRESHEVTLERNGYPEVAWFTDAHSPIRDENCAVVGVLSVMTETTGERSIAKRLAFETDLADELRGLDDPDAVVATATRLLGEHLEVARCGFGPVDLQTGRMTAGYRWADGREANYSERTPHPKVIAACRAGRLARLAANPDGRGPAVLAGADRSSPSIGIIAPLLREGDWVASLWLRAPEARRWTEDEEATVRFVAERTWAAVERARAERELRNSEARLELAIRASRLGIWDMQAGVELPILSPRAREIWGLGPDDLVTADDMLTRIVPQDRAYALASATAREGELSRKPFEFRIRHPDGEVRTVRAHVETLFGERDGVRCAVRSVGVVEDVTDERRIQQALRDSEARLRESESRLRFAQAAGQIGAFELLPRKGLVLASESYCQIWGLPVQPQHAIADVLALVHPDDREALQAPRGKTGQLDHQEYRIFRGDTGEERWIARRGEVMKDETGRRRYLGVVYDITERKRAEQALRELNERLETEVAARTAERDRMWRLSAELMVVGDTDGSTVAVNPAWEAVLGWRPDEVTSKALRDMVHPDDLTSDVAAARSLRDGVPLVRRENRMRARDGSYRWIAWTSVFEAGYFLALGRDITDERAAAEALRRAEEELRQAQKMEAVGQLTGGIAHDFNNMLAIVIGGLDLAQRRIERGESAERHIDAAREGALRAAALTQRLLAFSRRQPLSPKIVNLNQLVGEMSELLRRTLGEPVTLETELAGGLWPVRVDPHQMESALLNLAVNARDAMPEGGLLTVRTANLPSAQVPSAMVPGLETCDYVAISVTDRGSGMAPDILARVFEPFFTTKAVGKGTGLGLSMVYGFVRQSGGEVAIASEPGKGATVTIYLPRREGAEAQAEAAVAEDTIPRAAGGEVVLVVEDEDEVRQMSAEALTELGYQVRAASSGEAALQVMEGMPRLDLLFTDVVMPGMTGRQLAEAARARSPSLKVLYTTGYTPDSVVHDGVLDEGVELLPKPFSISELADKVRAVLDL